MTCASRMKSFAETGFSGNGIGQYTSSDQPIAKTFFSSGSFFIDPLGAHRCIKTCAGTFTEVVKF